MCLLLPVSLELSLQNVQVTIAHSVCVCVLDPVGVLWLC